MRHSYRRRVHLWAGHRVGEAPGPGCRRDRRSGRVPREDSTERARIFRYLSPDSSKFERELDVADADEAWRALQSLGEAAALRKGDIVYVGDVYFELDGDGGWRPLPPGPLTIKLYEAAIRAAK